jgi:ribosomal protein S18 acetylase RimI-like enzyme
MAKPSVVLIPWDPASQQHIDRMVEQRRTCGWHAQRVPVQWRDAHLAGTKCVYWIAFAQDEPQSETYNKQHVDKYPNETGELVDTSETLLAKPCTPTKKKFLPIGHIALETHDPSVTKKLGIEVPDEGSYWIKSLYVSYILQALGVGGSAMRIAERMLTEEPHHAKHLLLDTVHHADQQDEGFAMATYGALFKVPTQSWYERQGYRLIATISNYYTDPDANGKIWPCRTVFLQKDLA